MSKYYFQDSDPEVCYQLSYFKQLLIDEEIEEMVLVEAARSKDNFYFYCKFQMEVGEKEEGTCGQSCINYIPRNGIKGCCKYYSKTYEPTDKKITIRKGE